MSLEAITRPPAGLAEAVRQDSINVIDAAVGLAVKGLMTASEVIDIGCMTPDCLTVVTLLRVAQAAGVKASSLLA